VLCRAGLDVINAKRKIPALADYRVKLLLVSSYFLLINKLTRKGKKEASARRSLCLRYWFVCDTDFYILHGRIL
jgi:hypothetical protein